MRYVAAVLILIGLVASSSTSISAQEDGDLDCPNSVTQYFHQGDVVTLRIEYQFSGTKMVESIEVQPYVYIEYNIDGVLLNVIGGPVCNQFSGKRGWLLQSQRNPEIAGWLSDGYLEAGQEYQTFELYSTATLPPRVLVPNDDGALFHPEPDELCPPEPSIFVLGDLVVPARSDTRILPFGPLAGSWSWFLWSTGALEITDGPICDAGLRLWYVQDDNYHFGGWVIETYHREPNIQLASETDLMADPDHGYSTILQMTAIQ